MSKVNAKALGYEVGQEFVVIANHEDEGVSCEAGEHRFKVGDRVILKRDDGTDCPAFHIKGNIAKTWYVALSCVVPVEVSVGPKGVTHTKWSDAPEGATHYSHYHEHGGKWHKLEDGAWSFFTIHGTPRWVPYSGARLAYPDTQEAIPGGVSVDTDKVTKELELVNARLTRTGAKLGRQRKIVEATEQRQKDLRAEQTKLKGKLALAKARDAAVAKLVAEKPKPVVKITCAKELVELMHDASKWKAGMTVINRKDDDSCIPKGFKAVLTRDAEVDDDGDIFIRFEDNEGDERHRFAKEYQLVTTELV